MLLSRLSLLTVVLLRSAISDKVSPFSYGYGLRSCGSSASCALPSCRGYGCGLVYLYLRTLAQQLLSIVCVDAFLVVYETAYECGRELIADA